MRALWVVVLGAACASTVRTCPTDTKLLTRELASGREEWCVAPAAGVTALPVPGRDVSSLLAMAQPATMGPGVRGPFTHWYPGGGIESHGTYAAAGDRSVADGVWGFWYPDGSRKAVGRYENGRPVGCFALRDEQGGEVTGVVEGEQLRVEPCAPPSDDLVIRAAEERSNPPASRRLWGDITLRTVPQAGAFGASNPTQRDPDPEARATVELALRRHLGPVRIGPSFALRISDSDDTRGYTAGILAAYALPLSLPRLAVEIEGALAVDYVAVDARRADVPGSSSVSLWSPFLGARIAMSYAVSRSLAFVAGARVEGAWSRTLEKQVSYCAPFCGPYMTESWDVGGPMFGADLGLRILIR